jgi:transcriptional regulator with XRE-family HTH domain
MEEAAIERAMNFRQELERELALRRRRNPSYSLRAFARDLRTDHATLSQILRGRRMLSARMTIALGRRLGFGTSTLVDAGVRQNAVAIVRLVRSGDFQPNSRWIAIRTGIPIDAVNVALTQLLRDGCLVMRSVGCWAIRKQAYV